MGEQSKNCEQTSGIGPSDPKMISLQKGLIEAISRCPSPQSRKMPRRLFMTSILVHFLWWRNALRYWFRKIATDITNKKL